MKAGSLSELFSTNVTEDLPDGERVHDPSAVHEVMHTLAGTTGVAESGEHRSSGKLLFLLCLVIS